MANYMGTARTNYFRVTDPEQLKKIVDHIRTEDKVYMFGPRGGPDDDPVYGFGAYESCCERALFDGEEIDGEDEDSRIEIFADIQKILPPGEVFVYTEVGYEKLRYVVGYCCVVTNDTIHGFNLEDIARKKAIELTGNADIELRMGY